ALLATKDSSPRTHAGVASELGNLFREELGTELTSEFSRIQQLREDADYGVETDIDKETAQDIFSTAQRFVDRVDELL
ncbi:MAG: HEPN domain-containing protein, partial [Candidatus Nanohaloarchaea archaeon]|nr:HEPN domain-containing protein [Candidatus Nanohaloarchaea archaeon]